MDTNFFNDFSEDYKPDEDGYITFEPGQTINEMAAYTFPGEDVTRFKEITDLNPDIYTEDYFGVAELDLNKKPKKIKIPFEADLLRFASPVLYKINTELSGVKNIAAKLEKIPFLKGYSKEAVAAIESGISKIYSPSLLSDTADMYDDQELPRLIPWLLSGKP